MQHHHLKRSPFLLLVSGVLASATPLVFGASINFSQMPPGNGGREPAPNVILSVDDSGSMSYIDSGSDTRMQILKRALNKTFGDANAVPPTLGKFADGDIRLAWQAMRDFGNPGNNAPNARVLTPGAANAMQPFSGQHRKDFSDFVKSLKAQGYTPSHSMMRNAHNYLRTPAGIHSPWAHVPGVAQDSGSYLPCRRAYHVFMTDGLWTGTRDTLLAEGNEAGNADSEDLTLGDGITRYNPRLALNRVYRDAITDTTRQVNTLSDYAFRSWATDLQNGEGGTANMPNKVRPIMRQPIAESWPNPTCSANVKEPCISLPPFNNPRNDPATWQHLATYSIGFGKSAIDWPLHEKDAQGKPFRNILPQWDSATGMYGTGFGELVNHTKGWVDLFPEIEITGDDTRRASDLWHMAINGRGRFYPALDADALDTAFDNILESILIESIRPLVSAAASTGFVRKGSIMFVGGYHTEFFDGRLKARAIDPLTAAVSPKVLWDAAALLNDRSPESRFVMSSHQGVGIPWSVYRRLPMAQQAALGVNIQGKTDYLGVERMRYIRGDRTMEVAAGGAFRDRGGVLGDIVHSTIWYTGIPMSGFTEDHYDDFRRARNRRTPMLYVGANDGMLHGFRADNGKELLAFIPASVILNNGTRLTEPRSRHTYTMDGSPFSGDAFINPVDANSPKRWHTILIGSMGVGGVGYFGLDITAPANFNDANVSKLVLFDTTTNRSGSRQDKDLGFITSPPALGDESTGHSPNIVKLNNGRWAALLGNGYNSANEAPVLYVQYLDGTRKALKISPCKIAVGAYACPFKQNNGLSGVQGIDLNGDGKVDVAYAGDLAGNLWKFDLASSSDTQWAAAYKRGSHEGAPFFVASRNGQRQAITTAPFWRPHPKGGVQITFGTGRNLSDLDIRSADVQTLYSLHDDSSFKIKDGEMELIPSEPINQASDTSLPATLVQQTLAPQGFAQNGSDYYTSSTQTVDYYGSPAATPTQAAVLPHRGWYMDFPISRQRTLRNIMAYVGPHILVPSSIPAAGSNSFATNQPGPVAGSNETCTPSFVPERLFYSILNQFTGAPPTDEPFGLVATPTLSPKTIASVSMTESVIGVPISFRTPSGIRLINSQCAIGVNCQPTALGSSAITGVRASWTHIQ